MLPWASPLAHSSNVGWLRTWARYSPAKASQVTSSFCQRRRRSRLGPNSFSQSPTRRDALAIPRGQRLITRRRKPSERSGRSYTRLVAMVGMASRVSRPLGGSSAPTEAPPGRQPTPRRPQRPPSSRWGPSASAGPPRTGWPGRPSPDEVRRRPPPG